MCAVTATFLITFADAYLMCAVEAEAEHSASSPWPPFPVSTHRGLFITWFFCSFLISGRLAVVVVVVSLVLLLAILHRWAVPIDSSYCNKLFMMRTYLYWAEIQCCQYGVTGPSFLMHIPHILISNLAKVPHCDAQLSGCETVVRHHPHVIVQDFTQHGSGTL